MNLNLNHWRSFRGAVPELHMAAATSLVVAVLSLSLMVE